jgi:putative tryptophan/tyrosine transport system substrate-binding protein
LRVVLTFAEGCCVRRRDFIKAIAGSAAAWPLAARAQQTAIPVIGWLSPGSPRTDQFRLVAFERGLAETSHILGTDVRIEYRWADDENNRLRALAAELVQVGVNVIAAAGVAAALQAKAASLIVPIVFVTGIDPVLVGLVATLDRPGGNITGITDLTTELGPKQLEILHEVAPTAQRIALLVNPNNPSAHAVSDQLATAASILGLKLDVFQASGERDFEKIFAEMIAVRIDGLVIGTDALFNSHNERLAKLAADHALPSIHTLRLFPAAGGLMSYGGRLTDGYRQAGIYCGRILKGEKPADLPVQQTTKVELVINLRTAKALALTVPLSLMGRADEVIE